MAVDASATAMASLRICVPFQCVLFEPREHIMRAPVAAQVCDCSVLLLKSLSQPIVTKKVTLLAFDKSVLPQRRENLIDRGSSLCVDNCAAIWPSIDAEPAAH